MARRRDAVHRPGSYAAARTVATNCCLRLSVSAAFCGATLMQTLDTESVAAPPRCCPPAPVQFSVYEVVALTALVTCVPLLGKVTAPAIAGGARVGIVGPKPGRRIAGRRPRTDTRSAWPWESHSLYAGARGAAGTDAAQRIGCGRAQSYVLCVPLAVSVPLPSARTRSESTAPLESTETEPLPDPRPPRRAPHWQHCAGRGNQHHRCRHRRRGASCTGTYQRINRRRGDRARSSACRSARAYRSNHRRQCKNRRRWNSR